MRATAVIIKDKKILLIHRFRDGREFFVLPGGGVEEGETIEQAVIREVKEETSFDAIINKKLWEIQNDYNGNKNMHHYFLITDFSGELMLGGEEAIENSPTNSYTLEWHDIDDIRSLPLKPEEVILKIIELER
jgi:8-oxo-dGTP pyrophosphatase MutT (NUDIX family)